MNTFSPLQEHLLILLADGDFHSGNSLGALLGVSRTAIWKNIKQLSSLGVPICTNKARGYQLSSYIPLQKNKIINALKTQKLADTVNLFLFTEVDSTNQFLKDLPPQHQLSVCCAEKQTAGRGRFGREWESPFGDNIYLSMRLEKQCCISELSGLSLVVSLAIADSLSYLKENIQVKWPNDLLWQDRKLCGILIEINAENNGIINIILGVGLNVNNAARNPSWCSLEEITGKKFDRNQLIATIITTLHHYLERFFISKLTDFLDSWNTKDYLCGKKIKINQGGKIREGKAQGINQFGQLNLLNEKGELEVISSGEASIHR